MMLQKSRQKKQNFSYDYKHDLALCLQKGRSMIEMLGVLAIIGVLSVGGIAGYSKAIAKNKINDTIDQVTTIVTNIRTLYTQQNNYSDLTHEHAKDIGAIPKEMIVKSYSSANNGDAEIVAEHVKHRFLGNVIVQGAASRTSEFGNSASKTAFIVDFDGLTRDACVTMASADWGASNSSGLIGIQVKGTDNEGVDPETLFIGCNGAHADNGTATACPNGTVQKIPMSVDEASRACNCFGSNTCSIVWKYF